MSDEEFAAAKAGGRPSMEQEAAINDANIPPGFRSPGVGETSQPANAPDPSQIAGGVHQSGTRWDELAAKAKAMYPRVAPYGQMAVNMLPGGQFLPAARALNPLNGGSAPSTPEGVKKEENGLDRAEQMAASAKQAQAAAQPPQGAQFQQMQNAPAHVIPGGEQLAERTVKMGTPIDAGTREELDDSQKVAQGAVNLGTQIGLAKAAAADAHNTAMIGYDAHAATELAARKAEENKIANVHNAKINEWTEKAANGRIDPNRYWNKMDTGHKMLAHIGMFFGALGTAFSGGPNTALQNINSLIDNDIDAQKQNILKAPRMAEMHKGLLGDLYKHSGDMDVAESQARVVYNNGAIAKIQQTIGKDIGDAEATKAGMDAIAALEAKNVDEKIKIQQLAKNEEQRRYVMRQAQVVGGGPRMGTINAKPETIVHTPEGKTVIARSDKEGEDIRNRQGFENKLGGILKEMKALDDSATYTDIANPFSAYNKRRAVLQEQALPAMSTATQQGTIRESEREPIQNALGGNYGIKDKLLGNKPQTELASATIKEGSRDLIDAQHGVQVEEVMVQDPKTGEWSQKAIPIAQNYQSPRMPEKKK